MAKSQTEILSAMIELLNPLSSEDRQRLVNATLTFLGEGTPPLRKSGIEPSDDDESETDLSPRARTWLKQNGLSLGQLQQVFNIADGKAEVLSVTGGSTKEKTINSYVLTGLASYIVGGDLKFDDKSARDVCSTSGCYDRTNHATYLKARSNLFSGSKEGGWALTSPGLKHAAELVKALAQ